jgi:hypothetical protein
MNAAVYKVSLRTLQCKASVQRFDVAAINHPPVTEKHGEVLETAVSLFSYKNQHEKGVLPEQCNLP